MTHDWRALVLIVSAALMVASCTLRGRKCDADSDCFQGEVCTDGRCQASPGGSTEMGSDTSDMSVDVFVPQTCGNMALDRGEKCDDTSPIECPTDCDDGVACTADLLTGSAEACSARCTHAPINECVDADGCCRVGCTANTDDDCESVCGNGRVEPGETCDGNCPVCSDVDQCTTLTTTGSPGTCDVECNTETIDDCIDGDGCCPPACDSMSDNDCSATCGNGVVDQMETCDGNCPTACDDQDACTTDQLLGAPGNCTARCSHTAVTACSDGDGCCPTGCDSTNDSDCSVECGNGIIEQGEVCDGNCPTSCNDGDACTTDTLTGSAASCDAQCEFATIDSCTDGDGCCPPQCDSSNDSDCDIECGNGVVEAGETCDGDCPASCDDGDPCTADSSSGAAATCDLVCSNTTITACSMTSDGCCPDSCTTSNDADCEPPTCDATNCPCDNFVELCVDGHCEAQTLLTSDDCDRACDPDEFCQNNNLGNVCSNGSCACDCSFCSATQGCDPSTGPCVDVKTNLNGDCSLACDPDAYCEAEWGAGSECIESTGSCIVPCSSSTCDCEGSQLCFDGDCTFVVPQEERGCSFACDPDAYCEAAFGTPLSCTQGQDAESDSCEAF